LGILLDAENKNILVVQGVKNYGGEPDRGKVKVLRSDNGGEYTSTEFKAYLAGKGIEYQLSIPGQP